MAQQIWDAGDYAGNAAFVPALGATMLDVLNAQPDERILDIGCGDGVLTASIAATGAVVHGMDMSESLLGVARAAGLDVSHGDAQALTYSQTFDAVFTNAALHWMPHTDALLTGVRAALVPGGRFVGECGGLGNVAAIATALQASLERYGVEDVARRNPWTFRSDTAFRAALEHHGFAVHEIALVPRPTALPTGIEGWLATFAGSHVAGLDEALQQQVLRYTVSLLEPRLCDEQGQWVADYVRLRFVATRN